MAAGFFGINLFLATQNGVDKTRCRVFCADGMSAAGLDHFIGEVRVSCRRDNWASPFYIRFDHAYQGRAIKVVPTDTAIHDDRIPLMCREHPGGLFDALGACHLVAVTPELFLPLFTPLFFVVYQQNFFHLFFLVVNHYERLGFTVSKFTSFL